VLGEPGEALRELLRQESIQVANNQDGEVDLAICILSEGARARPPASAARVLLLADGADAETLLTRAIAAAAERGLFRSDDSLPGMALLERTSLPEAVDRYERRLHRLEREGAVYELLSVEYRQAMADRDRALHRAAPEPFDPLPAHSPIPALLDGIAELRRRFAPPDSLRTRAIDWSAARLRAATSTTLRALDVRDEMLHRLRGLLKSP